MERHHELRGAVEHLDKWQTETGQIQRRLDRLVAKKKKGKKTHCKDRKRTRRSEFMKTKIMRLTWKNLCPICFYAYLKDREFPPSEQNKIATQKLWTEIASGVILSC